MLNPDFNEFAELLNAHRVDYLLVGGYALAAHGHPRYTGDIDFWVRPAADNIDRLLRVLDAFGFGSLGLKPGDFAADTVVQLGQPPRRIDLLTSIDGGNALGNWATQPIRQIGACLPVAVQDGGYTLHQLNSRSAQIAQATSQRQVSDKPSTSH